MHGHRRRLLPRLPESLAPSRAGDALCALAHWRIVAKSARAPRSPETDEQAAYVLAWNEETPVDRNAPSRVERYRGALLGLAPGDAVGTTLEFGSPGTFAPITDMVGGGPFISEPGQ